MRSLLLRVLLVVVAVPLAACEDEPFCAELGDAFLRFADKGARCLPPNPPNLHLDVASCEAALSDCGNKDVAELQALIHCYDNLGVCAPEDAADFMEDQGKCLSNVELSESCQKALAQAFDAAP